MIRYPYKRRTVMLNIAICDDVRAICHFIENTLIQYTQENKIRAEIEVFYDGTDLYDFICREHGFDLIYLDIEMPSLSGIELSRNIRSVLCDSDTEIVFVSGTTQYDRQLFDVQPLHFIAKPIDPQLVIKDLELARKRCGDLEKTHIFQIGRDTFRIPYNQILYFESRNRKITVVTETNRFTYYGQLQKIIPSLPIQFCRIHKSYIINLRRVMEFHAAAVTMSDGAVLSIGETYKQSFKEYKKRQLLEEEDV